MGQVVSFDTPAIMTTSGFSDNKTAWATLTAGTVSSVYTTACDQALHQQNLAQNVSELGQSALELTQNATELGQNAFELTQNASQLFQRSKELTQNATKEDEAARG